MVKIFALLVSVIVIIIGGIAVYISFVLPHTQPAPDIKVNVSAQNIERGRYLANNVAVCMDCHSQRNMNSFAGPVVPGTLGQGGERFGKAEGFPGDIYAPNITPYALASWTDGEIFRAITSGISKNGKAIFPVMNYLNYGKLDKEDIYAIIAYLRTLPAIENKTRERKLDFPVNLLVNTMPTPPGFSTRPDSTDLVPYGKYLVTLSGCMTCHSHLNKGEIVPGSEYGGGTEFPMPGGKIIRSANITPHPETGIGSWSRENFIARFRQYADSSKWSGTAHVQEFNTIMPWLLYANMNENDLGAIYAYLKTVTPIHNAVEKFAAKVDPDRK